MMDLAMFATNLVGRITLAHSYGTTIPAEGEIVAVKIDRGDLVCYIENPDGGVWSCNAECLKLKPRAHGQ